MPDKSGKVVVENVNHPGKSERVDAAMYEAMKSALLKVVPKKPPGMTDEEMRAAALAHLPKALFPGGAKAGWWAKVVQLDLEAKGTIAREKTKPLRFHKL